MKNSLKTLFLLATLTMSTVVFSQEVKKTEIIKIKTSAQCDQCKERIEKTMAYEKGVKKSNLDIETAVLTVEYSPKKTSPEKIKKAVSDVGYDADEVLANPEAYQKLPTCCKKGGHK